MATTESPCKFCSASVILTKDENGQPLALDTRVDVYRFDRATDKARQAFDTTQLFADHRHVCEFLRKDSEVRELADRVAELEGVDPETGEEVTTATPRTIEESETKTACKHGLEDYVDGECMLCGAKV